MTIKLNNLSDRFLIYALQGGQKHVEGWLEPGALTVTALLDQLQQQAGIEGAVAEIGVHHGRHLIALRLLCRSNQSALAIDIFEDQNLNIDSSGHGDREILIRNIMQHVGQLDGVLIKKADSTTTHAEDINSWLDAPVRIFSVDGCHTQEHTRNDICLAAEVLTPGGLIIVDDIFNNQWPGVLAGAKEFFSVHNSQDMTPIFAADNKLIICHRDYRELYLDNLSRSLKGILGEVDDKIVLFDEEVIGQSFPPLDYFINSDAHARIFGKQLLRAMCFTANTHPAYEFISGWSAAESWGTWSDGGEAIVALFLDQTPNELLVIEFVAHALLTSDRPTLNVYLEVNGHATQPLIFNNSEEAREICISVPKEWVHEPKIELHFQISNPRSPLELGISNDPRRLGIALRRLKINMFSYASYPRRLNLGCGLKHRRGYLNVDLHQVHSPDLVADVTNLSMLPDDYYEEVVAHDLLEHIQRNRTVETLAEWNRVLQPGGRLELKVPGLLQLLALFQRPENQGVEQQLKLLRSLFGSQAYTGDYHYTGFTPTLLAHYLERTGFTQDQLTVEDEWLLVAVAHKTRSLDAQEDLILIANPEEFLEKAYQSLLGRDLDPEGRDCYLHQLRTGEIAREGVLEVLRTSEESVI